MRALLITVVLVGCGVEPDEGALPASALGPPVQMTMVAPSAALPGETVVVDVWDAPVGERVQLAASRAASGAPVCPPVLGGACTDLAAPVVSLGAVVADAAGRARFTLTLPATLPAGPARLQALSTRPVGQASLSSSSTLMVLAPGGDPDGDGLSSADERLLGTDPTLADTDRGGLRDDLDPDPLDAADDVGGAPFASLPGDTALDLPAGEQGGARAAKGASSTLVVWQDSRAGVTGAPQVGSSPVDVLAQRFDDRGQPLDAVPFVVAAGVMDQVTPDVAWNGSAWLVVWASRRPVGAYGTTLDVVGARVAPDGTVLDATPLPIGANPVQDEVRPAVASDGVGWVVAWRGGVGFGQEAVLAAAVSPAGDVGGASALWQTVGGVGYTTPYAVDLAFAGGRYFAVGVHDTPGAFNADVYGLGLGADGAPLGPELQLTATAANEGEVAIASNGSVFGLSWYDDALWGEIRATPMQPTGVMATPGGLVLASGLYGTSPSTAIDWDGAGWLVAWDPGADVQLARLSPGGALRVGSPFVAAPGTWAMRQPFVVGLGADAMVGWTDSRLYNPSALGSTDLWGVVLDATGAPGPDAPLTRSAPAQSHVDVAGPVNGAYLMVFVSETSDTRRLMAQRVDAAGAALDAEPTVLATSSTYLTRPAVAHDGQRWLVVFEDQGRSWFVRVDDAGVALDPAPIEAAPGGYPDVAALGGDFLIVTSSMPPLQFHLLDILGRRVRGSDGALLDPAPTVLALGYNQHPTVAAAGDRWLVAWQNHLTHNTGASVVWARGVLPGGGLTGAFVGGQATTLNRTPAIAFDGATAYVAWSDGAGVRGRRLLPDGTPVDADAGVVVADAPGEQLRPDACWDGAAWRVVWQDLRAEASSLDAAGLGDVYTASVSTGGVVGAARAVTARPDRLEVLPAVSGDCALTAAAWFDGDTVRAGVRAAP
jgi:hypothetical protein